MTIFYSEKKIVVPIIEQSNLQIESTSSNGETTRFKTLLDWGGLGKAILEANIEEGCKVTAIILEAKIDGQFVKLHLDVKKTLKEVFHSMK